MFYLKSPKSNTAHIALDDALSDIEKGNVGDIPKHLKNPSDTFKYPQTIKMLLLTAILT